jgi:hypothetical protein
LRQQALNLNAGPCGEANRTRFYDLSLRVLHAFRLRLCD